jgi:hypothetical protein
LNISLTSGYLQKRNRDHRLLIMNLPSRDHKQLIMNPLARLRYNPPSKHSPNSMIVIFDLLYNKLPTQPQWL